MSRAPASALVTLDAVDVDIDGSSILHGITLTLRADEHWGFTGGNGSGKSTLLALIAGRRWPAPGRGRRRYDFGNGPESDAVTARDRIALLGHELQDLYAARGWNWRALDVVLSGLSRTDVPQRRRTPDQTDEAHALLERLDLGHLARRRILELSRGEQRRVLIARALAFRPALLLLDEPASGLDAAARQQLEVLLAEAAALTTVAVAAHRDSQLPGIVNRRAVIEAGRLQPAADTGRPGAAPPQRSAEERRPERPRSQRDDEAGILIRLANASVWIDGRPVLENLDWRLRDDEHWLVSGPNGAGKSTLLRLLHGEIRPARGGSIAWPGLGNPGDVWTLRRRVALVSAELQARYRYPTTVFDAIGSGFTASIGRVRDLSGAQQARVETLLTEFGLGGLRHRLLGSLSYGQRHRALIARTLASEPRVLLLDEPWEGLDTASSEIVCAALTRYALGGTRIVCVSHVGTGGLPLNRQLELRDGRVVSVDGSAGPRGSSASARRPEAGCRRH